MSPSPASRHARPLRVLYVEDAVGFRQEMVELHLATEEVTEVSTVRAAMIALTATSSVEFDLALLDYELPDGTGADVIAELRRHSPRVLIVGVSADRLFNERLAAAGADRTMEKRTLRRLPDLLEKLGMGTRG